MHYLGNRERRLSKSVLLQLILGASLVAQPATVQPDPTPAVNSPSFRLEREPVTGGAELITLFSRLQDPASGEEALDVPLVSVLRDTLGDSDPATDRLRYVWILTSTRPTPLQRAASALSFFRFRAGGKRHANQLPAPALDLASPGKTVWTNLLANSVQSTQFDPLGVLVRASTRTYRGNSSDYRKLHIFQALGALDGLEREADRRGLFSDADLREVYSRLSLSDRTLGGLVRANKLTRFYDKETSERAQTRGHNWELLRQRAELSGLYFQPLALPQAAPSEALLWIAGEDLDRRGSHRFERQFLSIANPWTDERLLHWTGYRQVRYYDAENRPVSCDATGARPVEMIPLALYSLDHPRTPLLLADFRDTMQLKRSELLRHAATTVLTGVFGITRFGNWPFFAADSTWTFVRGRHGAAVNRSARLGAYAEARDFIARDTTLDPKLKTELLHRLDHLALNPLENGIATEATVAKEQDAALLQYAQSANGLNARLGHDRRKELNSYTHSRPWRLLAGLGHAFAASSHTNVTRPDPDLLAELAAQRRAAYHVRFLERLLASSPRPDVVWNTLDISRSIQALASEPDAGGHAVRLIADVFARSADTELRFVCLRALRRSELEQAHNELWRLSHDLNIGDTWRAICNRYLNGDTEPSQPAMPVGQQ